MKISDVCVCVCVCVWGGGGGGGGGWVWMCAGVRCGAKQSTVNVFRGEGGLEEVRMGGGTKY